MLIMPRLPCAIAYPSTFSAFMILDRPVVAVGGAPSPLPPSKPWIGGSPQASGKSPSAGPGGPTPESAAVDDPNRRIFFFEISIC